MVPLRSSSSSALGRSRRKKLIYLRASLIALLSSLFFQTQSGALFCNGLGLSHREIIRLSFTFCNVPFTKIGLGCRQSPDWAYHVRGSTSSWLWDRTRGLPRVFPFLGNCPLFRLPPEPLFLPFPPNNNHNVLSVGRQTRGLLVGRGTPRGLSKPKVALGGLLRMGLFFAVFVFPLNTRLLGRALHTRPPPCRGGFLCDAPFA